MAQVDRRAPYPALTLLMRTPGQKGVRRFAMTCAANLPGQMEPNSQRFTLQMDQFHVTGTVEEIYDRPREPMPRRTYETLLERAAPTTEVRRIEQRQDGGNADGVESTRSPSGWSREESPELEWRRHSRSARNERKERSVPAKERKERSVPEKRKERSVPAELPRRYWNKELTPKDVRDLSHDFQICTHHIKGSCRHAGSCKFLHEGAQGTESQRQVLELLAGKKNSSAQPKVRKRSRSRDRIPARNSVGTETKSEAPQPSLIPKAETRQYGRKTGPGGVVWHDASSTHPIIHIIRTAFGRYQNADNTTKVPFCSFGVDEHDVAGDGAMWVLDQDAYSDFQWEMGATLSVVLNHFLNGPFTFGEPPLSSAPAFSMHAGARKFILFCTKCRTCCEYGHTRVEHGTKIYPIEQIRMPACCINWLKPSKISAGDVKWKDHTI